MESILIWMHLIKIDKTLIIVFWSGGVHIVFSRFVWKYWKDCHFSARRNIIWAVRLWACFKINILLFQMSFMFENIHFHVPDVIFLKKMLWMPSIIFNNSFLCPGYHLCFEISFLCYGCHSCFKILVYTFTKEKRFAFCKFC